MSLAPATARLRPVPTVETHTFANQDRDFPEWHGGIARYGFWAVVVDCPQWQALFDAAGRHVAAHVLPGYRRQPHITIAAAGLIDEAHLSVALRQRQTAAMRAANEVAFDLHAGPLGTFTGSPHVAIRDPSGALLRLRARLQAIARHDPPATYHPHLTIGLYRGAFSLSHMQQQLAAFRVPAVTPLRVRGVSFCAYSTRELQGGFEILDTIPLDDA